MRGTHWKMLGPLTLLSMVILTLTSHAQLAVFTDRAEWEGSVGASDTEDFDQADLQWLMTGPGFTYSEHRVGKISIGARGDYLGADNNPTIRDAIDLLSPNGTRHLGGVLSNFEVIMQATIVFARPVAAFGADWASAANQSGVRLMVDGQTVELARHLAGNGDGFLGIVAPDPFREVFLTSRLREDYGLDNISFPVPEPAVSDYLVTLALIGAGRARSKNCRG